MVYFDSGHLMYGGWDGQSYNAGNWGAGYDNFSADDTFHLRIVVLDGRVSVYVNDSTEPTVFGLPADYQGGYIYLASNSTGAEFSNLTVKELEHQELDRFVSYYSEDITYGSGNARDLTEAEPLKYWTEQAGTITRNDISSEINGVGAGTICDDLYMAELFLKEQTYKSFELNVDVKRGTSGWRRAFVGFGAKLGRHFQQSDGGTMVYFDSGHLMYGGWNGQSYNVGNWGAGYDGFSADETFHLRIVVQDGSASVYVDDYENPTVFELPSSYQGGYIYLASNSTGASFSNLTVKELKDKGNDFDAYAGYYSDNITYGSEDARDLTEVNPGEYWREMDGTITRRKVQPVDGLENQPVCDDLYMAELFLKEKTYKSFELNVDVKRGSDGWCRAFVGFGAELGCHFQQSGGGTTVYLDNNTLRYGGWDDQNAVYKEGDWGLSYKGIGKNDTFHLRVVVQDGRVSVYVNDDENPTAFELPGSYHGGYIYLASNSTGASFSNLTVEELEDKGNNFEAYAGYYSDNIAYGSEDARDLTEVNPEEYWREMDGTITRRKIQPVDGVENRPVCDDLYVAELFLKERKYENFELNVDVKRGSDGWCRAFVGFGAQLGCHFQQSGGGTTVYLDNNTLRYGGWDDLNAVYREGDWGLSYKEIGKNDTFHLRIVVQDMEAMVYVGDSDKPTSFGLDGSYQGGYIYLASNSTGATFSNLTVKELEDSGTDSTFDRFASYYSDYIAFGSEAASDLRQTNPKNFWRSEDGKIIRKKTRASDIRDRSFIAELFLKERTYENFELNVDITRGTSGWRRAFVGFGAEMGRHFQQSGGGTMVYLDHNSLRYGGWDDENSTYKEGDWGRYYGGIGENDTFHLRLQVMGGVAYVYVGDSTEPTKFAVSEDYDGGYIYLASNASDTTFANLTVREILEGEFNNFADYSSYYTERVSDEALVGVDPARYWTELDGVITRKKQNMGRNQQHDKWNECSYHLDKMAYLFLNGAYTEHENYQIELDYKGGTGAWGRAYMGFGAGMACTWREKDGGTVFFVDGSGTTNFEGNLYGNGAVIKDTFGKRLENYKSGERHHMKLVCRGGIYTIYVDDVEVKTLVVNKYNQGGRFFLATNSSGTEFSNIAVTILPDDGANFEGYDEWYSPNISSTPLTDVKEGTNWSIVDGIITRKAIDLDAQKVKGSKVYDVDVAYLYLSDQTYTNFKVELDYKHGTTGWRRSPIGFGAEIGKSFLDKNGGIICFPQPDGIMQITGNIKTNGRYGESVTWATYDMNGKNVSTIKPYDSEVWHHMVMEVEGGYVTVIIDGFSYHYELQLPGHYKGGYLYLTSNSAASQYRNITIEDYSVRDQGGTGWSPRQEDTDFDFSYRKKEETDSFWKWTYRKITRIKDE